MAVSGRETFALHSLLGCSFLAFPMRQTGDLLDPAHCLGLDLPALLWRPEGRSSLGGRTRSH